MEQEDRAEKKPEILETETISKSLLAFNAIVVVLIVGMVFVISNALSLNAEKNQASVIETIFVDPFASLQIEAKAGYVLDVLENKIIYRKNESTPFPLASITKLMTAFTATELAPRETKIVIKKEFLIDEGDTGLFDGEVWELHDLSDFSLLVSSNDGARSIASVVGAMDLKMGDFNLGRKDFILKMNIKAKELGLRQTSFTNESGLDVDGETGGSGSAEDVGQLMRYLIVNKPDIVEVTRYDSVKISSNTINHQATNTNVDINQISGLLASKTGYTEKAGGNLVVAFDASIGRPIIVVVLGSSILGRFKDVGLLVEASREYIKQ